MKAAPTLRLATQLVVTCVLAGNVLGSLPPGFLRVLRHPAVQVSVIMNVLDSLEMRDQWRRLAFAGMMAAVMNFCSRFVASVYKSSGGDFHVTAVILTTSFLLMLQAPRHTPS